MRKISFLIVFLSILFISVNSERKIADFEKEMKRIKNIVSPSIVKVISENQKKYVATGIAISGDMILTSTLITGHHYDKIYIQTVKGEEFDAKILGKDRGHSIIVLKLKDKVMKPIRISPKLEVGDWIALVGVFYNKFPSIIQGIVSSFSEEELILNAPVFPGVSGGAVVNKKGELVAVIRGRFGIAIEPDISIIDHQGEFILHSPKFQDKNLCYAVPAEKMLEIANQIEKYGEVQRGWLGIFFQSEKTGNRGVITYVVKDSPAEQAGLKRNDIIVSINGDGIQKYSEISRIVRSLPPGKVVNITVLRDQNPITLRVKIGLPKSIVQYDLGSFRIRMPEAPLVIPEINGALPQAQNFILYRKGSMSLGIDVIEINPELAEKFKVKEGYGLMIAKVYDKSAARRAGLQEGDIIVRANQRKIEILSDIREKLNELGEKAQLRIDFYRDGKLQSLDVDPDVIKDQFYGWDDFASKFNIISRFLGEAGSFRYQNILKEQLKNLETELKYLHEYGEKISEKEQREIEEEIEMVKNKLKESLEKEMKRIQNEKRRVVEENRKFREEELRLIKEIDQIRRKIKEKSKKEKKTV